MLPITRINTSNVSNVCFGHPIRCLNISALVNIGTKTGYESSFGPNRNTAKRAHIPEDADEAVPLPDLSELAGLVFAPEEAQQACPILYSRLCYQRARYHVVNSNKTL